MRGRFRGRWRLTALGFLVAACDPLALEENFVRIDVDPAEVSVEVGQSATVVVRTDEPNAPISISNGNPSVARVEQLERDEGDDAFVQRLRITGLREGRTSLSVSSSDRDSNVEMVQVEVRPGPPATVEMTPSTLTLAPGQTGRVTCTVRRGGVIVNETVRFASSNTFVADVAQDGTVTALQEGQSRIVCVLPSGESANAQLTVRAPPAPSTADIPGNYSLTGKKVSDSCPAGSFEDNVNNPGPISITAGTAGGESFVAIRSNTTMTGSYDPATGAYSGTGEITIGTGGQVLRETVNGVWKTNPIRFEGQLILEFFRDTSLICQVVYDVVYSRL